MRDIFKSILTVFYLLYAIGEIGLLFPIMITLVYLIGVQVVSSPIYKIRSEEALNRANKRAELWRVNRAINKQLKEDRKKVKETIKKID